MRNYISELNTETREELRDEILLESRRYSLSIYDISFIVNLEFLAIRLKTGLFRLLPLRGIYGSIEKLGVQFNENYIDLWLSLFRDFCIEEIMRRFPALD